MYINRFPHRLSVLRPRKNEYGEPVTDEKGDLIYDIVTLKRVKMIDEAPQFDLDGEFIYTEVESIPFGYRTSSLNTSRRADVVEATYKVDTPLFITPLEPGDLLKVTDFDRTYYGSLVKKASFGMGSIVWYDEAQN